MGETKYLHHRVGHRTVETTADNCDEANDQQDEADDRGDDCVGGKSGVVRRANMTGGNGSDRNCGGSDRLDNRAIGRYVDHSRRRLLDEDIAALVEGTFGERHELFLLWRVDNTANRCCADMRHSDYPAQGGAKQISAQPRMRR